MHDVLSSPQRPCEDCKACTIINHLLQMVPDLEALRVPSGRQRHESVTVWHELEQKEARCCRNTDGKLINSL